MIEEIQKILTDVEEGNLNALDAYIQLNEVSKRLTKVKSLIYDEAINEAEKFGEKTFNYHGKTITRKAAAGRWDFKGLQGYEELKSKIKETEALHKQAYQMLIKGKQVIDDNGEIVEPAKYTAGKDTLMIVDAR
jgi:hypothetical protein